MAEFLNHLEAVVPGLADAFCLAEQAVAVAERVAEDQATPAFWGIHSLIEKSAAKVGLAIESVDAAAWAEASDELDGAIGLVDAFNTDRVDSRSLYAVTTLLQGTKAQVDCRLAELQLVVTA